MDLDKIVDELKKFELVHSVLLFGSTTKKSMEKGRDIDICIIEKPGQSIKLKEKLRITRNLRENIDVSFFHDLPLNVRQRVLREGKILFTRNKYYIYTLVKETSFEMSKYRMIQEEYYKKTIERVKLKR